MAKAYASALYGRPRTSFARWPARRGSSSRHDHTLQASEVRGAMVIKIGLVRIFGAVMVPALKGIGLRVRRAAHALAEAETQHVRTSRA